MNFLCLKVLLSFLLYLSIYCTISKSDKKKKDKGIKNLKEVNFDEYDNFKLNYTTDIVSNGYILPDGIPNAKNFSSTTLAYVTPWNNYGYDVAKKHTNKFTLISPVWINLLYDGKEFLFTGGHDVDQGWITELRQNNPSVRILPRILFSNWNTQNFKAVVQSEYKTSELIERFNEFVKFYKFDGVVLEMWLQIGVYLPSDAVHFIRHLGTNFKNNKMILVLAIPPALYIQNREGYFNEDDFKRLQNSVDFFSLMTYDYSSGANHGPNAPLEWMKKCVEMLIPLNNHSMRSKILLGLNFYGYMLNYGDVKPIIRHEFMDLLKSAVKVETVWHKDVKEHEFKIHSLDGSVKSVWYPTLQSIELRLKLANSMGVGISIWEIGQGLDYFYSVL